VNIELILRSKHGNEHYIKRYIRFLTTRNSNVHEIQTKVRHHICPKANDLFPEYSSFEENSWNMILLTEREHFIAHMILWKAFGGSMTRAFHMMSNFKSNRIKSSKIYESLRLAIRKHLSENNHNKDGEQAKRAWAKCLPERRAKQSKLLAELNSKLKKKPTEFREYECPTCRDTLFFEEFVHQPWQPYHFCNKSCSMKYHNKVRRMTGFFDNYEHKPYKRRGDKPVWNKGKKCPNISGEKNGMKSLEARQKLSNSAKGRKLKILPDGKRTWIHPEKELEQSNE